MNTVRLIIFSSQLHDGVSVMNSREALFDGIRSFARLELGYPSTISTKRSAIGEFIDGGGVPDKDSADAPLTVCFIATGGTEEIFRQVVDSLPKPVILLSDGFHNSFAAALEISTYLKSEGIECRVFNAPLDCNPDFFKELERSLFSDGVQGGDAMPDAAINYSKKALAGFSKSIIGLVGGASPWLISSGIDIDYVTKTYGVRYIDIPLSDLEKEFGMANPSRPEITGTVNRMERFLTGGRTREDLAEAARMYIALKRLCSRYSLTAVTIKCFGILESCSTTACLALALLNDEGITAACEGDLQTLWTMIYARAEEGKVAFMANPASTNASELTIDFAHCTIPLSMVHGYRLPSHFESSLGIGIAGSVPCGRYRLLKVYGEKLDKVYSVEGDIIMNTNVPQRCRTQIRFKFDSSEDFHAFIRTAKGNHVAIIQQ